MKILMVHKFLYHKGGAETYTLDLGEELTKLGHQVEYFGMYDEKNEVGNDQNVYINKMDFHTSKLEKFKYPFKIIYSMEARRKIRKILYSFKPEIIHLNNFNYQITPSILYEIKKYKKTHPLKVIYTSHDYQLVCPNHMCFIPSTKKNCEKCLDGHYRHCIKNRCIHNSLAKSLLGAMESYVYHKKKTYKMIDYIICPSAFIQSKLNRDPILNNKTKVIPNFIKDINPKKLPKEEYILFFGRYTEEKGTYDLLKVAKHLKNQPFVFAGVGDLPCGDLPNVKNVGFKTGDDLNDLIEQAKFSVVPSKWYEVFGLSISESISLGTPVIGGNIGGIPEVVTDQYNGLLFKPGNIQDLQNKIESLLYNPDLLQNLTKNSSNDSFLDIHQYIEQLMIVYQSKS